MKEYIKKLLDFNTPWELLTAKKNKCYFIKSLVTKAMCDESKEYYYAFSEEGFNTYFEMLGLMFRMQSAGKLRRDFTFSLSGNVFGVKMWSDEKRKKIGFTDEELNVEREYDQVIEEYFNSVDVAGEV